MRESDPKKPHLNPRTVADIVTSSIKGLFKKFKNSITKDDVIYVPNFSDSHENIAGSKKLYNNVPTIQLMQNIANKSKNANDWYARVEREFDKMHNDPNFDDVPLAVRCYKVWVDFKKSLEDSG